VPRLLPAVLAFAVALAAPAQAERASFFLMDAIKGDNGEIVNAALAQQRATSAPVREFAAMLVRDHSATRTEAIAAARASRVGIPRGTTAEAQHLHRRLLRLSGAAFDEAFLTAMIRDHRKAITKYAEQRRTGDPLTRQLAEDALPHLSEHLRTALSLR
jgi:putative membrane protein